MADNGSSDGSGGGGAPTTTAMTNPAKQLPVWSDSGISDFVVGPYN
jgi:hypothetical protein